MAEEKDIDVRLTKVEGRVEKLEKNDEVQDKRLFNHGKELDGMSKLFVQNEGNMQLIKKDVENIDRTTKKTEDKLDKLADLRINDHFIDPVRINKERIEKSVMVIISLAIGFLFNYFIGR